MIEAMTVDDALTDADLDAMQERIAATSRGRWGAVLETRAATGGTSCIQIQSGVTEQDDEMYLSRFVDGRQVKVNPQLDANLEFIACAHEDMPRLVAELRRLRTELAAYTKRGGIEPCGMLGPCPV